MKTVIIGMGNMGSKYARLILEHKAGNMELAAVTRIRPERMELLKDVFPEDLKVYQSAEELYAGYDRGEFDADAVLIVTPHYDHEKQVMEAFRRGLHVLCDKPAGVYTRQARNMTEAYLAAREKKPDLLYGYVFHQRTFPIYQKMREIVMSGTYGGLKRVNWVITDWYRPDAYYTSSAWRATWKGDGGGTLLNQCPHNLDLMQWICGMPKRVWGFCHEGKYHSIEVEDDVTAYLEWEDGATGVFVASTGEAAGVNRLEITMDDALLVCEKGKLLICELDKPEREYRRETQNVFAKPNTVWKEIECPPGRGAYETVLSEFAGGGLIADGSEAIRSLFLSNAVYLSSWEHRMVEIPAQGSEAEKEFESCFEKWLKSKSECS